MITEVTFAYITHLHVKGKCPECGRETGSDKGNCLPADLGPTQGFWCEEHGEYEVPIDWGAELTKLINRTHPPAHRP